jgi:RecA/RadA recombinase
MPKSQAQINTNKINELYLVINELEKKIDVMNNAILNLMDVMDKLTDRSKDIELNIRYLYRKSKEEDNKTEPLKTGWLF